MWVVRERGFKAGSQISDFSNQVVPFTSNKKKTWEKNGKFSWVMLSLRFLLISQMEIFSWVYRYGAQDLS